MNKAQELRQLDVFENLLKEPPKEGEDWRRHIINTVTRYFIGSYPESIKRNNKYIKKMKETAEDEYSSAKESEIGLRALFNIPEHLNEMIRQVLAHFLPNEKQFMELKEDEWFIKEYPQFRITNKL